MAKNLAFPFRAVIFDLDGTLIDSVTDVANAVNRVLGDAGLAPIEGKLRNSLLGEGARARIQKAFALRGKNLEGPELQKRTDDFTRYYASNRLLNTKPYPGAATLLDQLSESGVQIGVCTNKDEKSACEILTALKLMPPISDVAGADTFGVRKPDPDHVLKLLQRMKADPSLTIFVGDSIHDVKAAKGAGVVVAAVTWGYSEDSVSGLGADHILEQFSDLLKVTSLAKQR
jgi:phosphoglycolate phosphatase